MKRYLKALCCLIASATLLQCTVTAVGNTFTDDPGITASEASDIEAPSIAISGRKATYATGESVRFDFTFTDNTELYKYEITVNDKPVALGILSGTSSLVSVTVKVAEGTNNVQVTVSDTTKNSAASRFSFTGVTEEKEEDPPTVQENTGTEAKVGQQVTVTIPSFRMYVNNQKVLSLNLQYPFIVYNDITYFPMTYYGSRFLGLTCDWSPVSGLVISKAPFASEGEGENTKAFELNDKSSYTANIATGPIMVNGKMIDNMSEDYPLLIFRDVTYFPLTWRFSVTEFGWEYTYTASKGLVINSK